jgi:hypothetical protein
VAAGDALAIGQGSDRKLAERIGDEGKIGRIATPGRLGDQGVERPGRHGHAVLVIVDLELAAPADQLQLAGFEHPSVVIAEDGQQHRVAQPGLGRVPVDIEVGGIAARRTVLQHIPPPGVPPLRDRHVVGHHVEHLPEPRLAQRATQPGMPFFTSQLLVDPRGIDHVIAMRAPAGSLEVGRAVEMADAEVREVAGDRGGLVEAEFRAKLDAIGGEGSLRHGGKTAARGGPLPTPPTPPPALPGS